MVFSRQLTNEEFEILSTIQEFVRSAHAESDSHDYAHVLTVARNAIKIAKEIPESVDPFVCVCAALLHDIGKTKHYFTQMHGFVGSAIAEEVLEGRGVEPLFRNRI